MQRVAGHDLTLCLATLQIKVGPIQVLRSHDSKTSMVPSVPRTSFLEEWFLRKQVPHPDSSTSSDWYASTTINEAVLSCEQIHDLHLHETTLLSPLLCVTDRLSLLIYELDPCAALSTLLDSPLPSRSCLPLRTLLPLEILTPPRDGCLSSSPLLLRCLGR